MEGTGVTSTAAMPIASPDSREAPPAGGKGQGKKKGKGPAKTTRSSVAGATPTAAALPQTTASSTAAPSTSSADVPPSAPRMYAWAAAAPPPAASSSLLATASATINSGRGPFPTMTRKHGVRCLLLSASPHVETYVRALARVVGPLAIVAASKMYGKVIFFLASEAAAQEAVERGLAVQGGVCPPRAARGPGRPPGPDLCPSFPPQCCPVTRPFHPGETCFCHQPSPVGLQVQLLLPSVARDGEALKRSFLVPHQGARYRVYFSTGEARCYLCRASGHIRRDCPLARQGGAPGIPETRQDIGLVIADTPGRPIPEPAPPPIRTTTSPAHAQGAPPLQRPDKRESPALAADNLAGPMEEGVAEIAPGMGESLPQGEFSLPYADPPSPHKPLSHRL
ncbi:unnamed protein product [Eretmochelys imbricata]